LPLKWSIMTQRGRKPKPVAAKIAAGNPGKRPLSTLVPAPIRGDMLCPQSVQRNQRASAYWAMYLANAAPGHLLPIDAPLLARLCVALAFADEAHDQIENLGLLVKAPNTGLPIQSPYLPVLNRQTEIARKLASELALPPSQRNRIGPYEPGRDGPSPWDALDL
jgi:phage terminase small subunit